MNGPPIVRRAAATETQAVSEVLTDAFPNEPALNWWLKQGPAKDRARRKFFDHSVKDGVHPRRELWAVPDAQGKLLGAALWLPVGAIAFELPPLRQLMITPLLFSVAGLRGMSRAIALGEQLASHHPHAPHMHLVFIGVSPAAQGRGVGSAMLKETLAVVDAQRVAAYLEASVEKNVALYQRHGFEVTAAFDVAGGGPRVWTMTRSARAA